ncbi:hypothetical protein PVAP13_6NG267593 [Panicum virgatum]|uniref:Uncharacterized protein n=1 Tax=Panicum virgatum TaxID=38727 RepID=A0A8T0R459_PANVG|nr:hypothetical protein PVAP13_6NG267593 [Panicum virgatum]
MERVLDPPAPTGFLHPSLSLGARTCCLLEHGASFHQCSVEGCGPPVSHGSRSGCCPRGAFSFEVPSAQAHGHGGGGRLLAPASFGVFVAHATILQVMMCLHFPAFVLALLCSLVWRNKLNGLFISDASTNPL